MESPLPRGWESSRSHARCSTARPVPERRELPDVGVSRRTFPDARTLKLGQPCGPSEPTVERPVDKRRPKTARTDRHDPSGRPGRSSQDHSRRLRESPQAHIARDDRNAPRGQTSMRDSDNTAERRGRLSEHPRQSGNAGRLFAMSCFWAEATASRSLRGVALAMFLT